MSGEHIMRPSDYGAELRVPPHSPEAEQGVLGGILIDNAAWDFAGDILIESDFFRFEHRLIYTAIGALVNASKPADVITVHEQLQRAGKADECGGMVYLHSLTLSVPSGAGVRHYAQIVRERSVERGLIAATDQAAQIAWSDTGNVGERTDRIAGLFVDLGTSPGDKEPQEIGRVLVHLLDRVNELAEGVALPGIPTGLAALDMALSGGIKPGMVLVVAARPSVGKSSLAADIAVNVARQGHSVLVLSQEMTNAELVARMLASASDVHLGHLLTGKLKDDEWSRLSNGADTISRLAIRVDDQPALTLQQIRSKARLVRRQDGLSLVVVDYLQLCSSTSLAAERRHHQIEAISRGLKALAKELNITVMVLSQLNRKSTDRADGEPDIADLKESGAIEEDADVVLLLHPVSNNGDGTMTILGKLGKNRGGPRVRFALSFTGSTQRWAASTASVARRGQVAEGVEL